MTRPIIQKIVVAGIIFFRGKVLIIQRSSDDSVFPGIWEIPSGKREFFEKSYNALVREVKEEAGIDIKVIQPLDVFEFKVDKKDEIRDSTQISFLCKPFGNPKVKLSNEHQDYKWIAESEIEGFTSMSSELKDVLHKAFRYLNENRKEN